jgi:hypothetical protein
MNNLMVYNQYLAVSLNLGFVLTPIIHSNNWGLRQRPSLTTNLVTQNWVPLCRGNPHLHSSLISLMNNAG